MEVKKSPKANLEQYRLVFFLVGFMLTLSIILIAMEATAKPADDEITERETGSVEQEEMIPVTRMEKQEIKEPPPKKQVVEKIEIVEDDEELEEEFKGEDISVDQDEVIEIQEFEEEEEVVEEKVFVIVEEMPSFNGEGKEGFRKFIAQEMKYPEVAVEMGVSGTVYVQFVVNKAGLVEDVKVVRGVDEALDAEAVRVVSSSPPWTPGKQRGKAVKVQFVFPIKFVLN